MDKAGMSLILQDGVATLALDLPHPKNAFRAEDAQRLSTMLDEAVAASARCLVLRGKPDCFCAGWDIAAIRPGQDDPVTTITEIVAPLCNKLQVLPIPTLSAVAGPALGFGFGLALSCDMCVAEEDALFGSPFRTIGMVPDTGTHFFLRERLGTARASELIFTGRLLTGAEAASLGLINAAVARGELDEAITRLAGAIASGPTQAFRLSKEILRAGGDLDAVMAHEARQLQAAFATADLQEGLRAFKERRKPIFQGR
ncbi:enoyl-CoA hydratase-related protein [Variovorax guangxiensis]|uniref:enoyl-CoA hydratase/isomerase family protein n=1 Tax=Variovorax guangxiensis TaxID=1775474 RepID=UPI00286680B7|nr:enoyl-CoA hydratase-related protein [Variovorax guangxiensis]MDR6861132.1 enoyl-CoA hydratase/carnithine racemase [Variovorax guangxiensis]